MRPAALGAAAGLLAWASWAQSGRGEVPAAPEADLLAARSLTHSAASLLHTPRSPPGTQARLLALCRFAHQLAPRDARAAGLLLDLYEGRGQFAHAIRPAEVCLRACPNDHALGRRWLALRLAVLQNADRRADLLTRVIAREDYPPSLRAAAAVEYASLLRGQGFDGPARAQYDGVLSRWDPLEPQALRGRLALRKDPSPADVAAARLKLLEGNPSAVDVAWRLAAGLDGLGLHRTALEFFEYVWQVAAQKKAADQVSHAFLVQYFNAMLNAGRFAQAVERFRPATRRFPESLDLAALLAEAYQALGRKGEADAQLAVMEAISKPARDSTPLSPAQAKNLAMFYLISRPDPVRALAFARLAARGRPQDAVVGRLLGAAELASGEAKLIEQGRARLEALVGRDLYAAFFLAGHQYRAGDAAAGGKTIAAGLARGGSGPALRRLVALAREHKVPVPAAPGRDKVAKLVAGFDRGALDLALHPGRHLALTIRGPQGPVMPGDPLVLEAVLAGSAKRPVRLGEWGLLNPRLELSVTAAGPKGGKFDRLLLARWPAATYLKPGKSVSLKTRIDVGPLARHLIEHPLDELTLTVRATLDPVQVGKTFQSWLPSVSVPPVKIVRASLLGRVDPSRPAGRGEAYRKLLLDITREIKRGRLAERMRAARRVAALLALVRNVELGRTRLPADLAKAVTKPMLLSMMRALLADKAPGVRAEMLAALQHVRMGKRILKLLAAPMEDPSSLVRLRVVELVGASGTPGRRAVVNYLARDEHELVRLMASAFQDRPGR